MLNVLDDPGVNVGVDALTGQVDWYIVLFVDTESAQGVVYVTEISVTCASRTRKKYVTVRIPS